jgi:hypothetical protein
MITVLLIGGVFKSLQFTSINSLAYADIEPRAMSRATSFASVAQQLSLSAGVAIGALILEIERHLRADGVVRAEDFATAFIVVATISAFSAAVFLRLPREAGASLSGRERAIGTPGSSVTEV